MYLDILTGGLPLTPQEKKNISLYFCFLLAESLQDKRNKGGKKEAAVLAVICKSR